MGLNFTKSQALALFYQRTLLDAGQLDTRYYTESELDAGQLDTRYYTESEVDSLITGIGIGTGDVFVGRDLYVTRDCYIGDAINVTGDMTVQGQLDMGVSGSTAGVIEIHEGSSVPPYFIINDKIGTQHYLSIGSSNVLRFGTNDPTVDEDINSPLQTSSQGLLVDGGNWMTGRFMTSDGRISSRIGVLTDIDDDFSTGSIDTAKWDASGTPTPSIGYIEFNSGTDLLDSTYKISGDFDIRVAIHGNSVNSGGGMIFRLTTSTVADAVGVSDKDFSDGIVAKFTSTTGGLQYYNYSIDGSASAAVQPSTSAAGNVFGAIRITRVGNEITIYRAESYSSEPDTTSNIIWTQIQQASYVPTRELAQVSFRLLTTATCRLYDYYVESGAAVPASASGPMLQIGSLVEISAGDPLISFYNGPESGTEVATMFADGSLGLVGDLDATGDIYIGGDIYGLKRQIGWYFDGADGDNTGDPVAWQVLAYGDGPYSLIDALVDYQVVTTGEATWDIEYCTQANMEAGTLSWTSIFTTAMTVDAGEYTSDSAATAKVLDSINLPEKARVRAKVTTPSGGEDATVSLVFKSGAS